jgi:hypothetical protein
MSSGKGGLSGPVNMVLGALWCITGTAVSVISYQAAAEFGGMYILTYGPILAGAGQFLGGLYQTMTKKRSA